MANSNGRQLQKILSLYNQIIICTSFKWKHLLDNTQILNLRLFDQTIVCKSLKWRWPSIEDNLKLLKVEYLSNRLLDPTQILNLSLYEISCFVHPTNKDDLQWKTTSLGSYSNFKLRHKWPKESLKILQMRTTYHGRRPTNITEKYFSNHLA